MHLEFLDASLTTHPAEKSRCRATGKRFEAADRCVKGRAAVMDLCWTRARRRGRTSLPLLHLLCCFLSLSRVSHRFCASLASCFPRYLSDFRLTFPSSSPQCVLSDNGADSAASHRGGSTLLRSLNLPQHTGMLCRAEQTGCAFFLSFLPFFLCPGDGVSSTARQSRGPVFTSPLPERPSASNRAHLRSCVSSLHR